MQRNWLATFKAKEVEATKQVPTPAQPARTSATRSSAIQPSVVQSPKYCKICTSLEKLCLNEYPITTDWQDNSGKEEEGQEQDKDKDNFSVGSDWDADLEEQDQKYLEKQKNNGNGTPPMKAQTYTI